MEFGSWKVTVTGIEWSGQGFQRFVIERNLLLQTIQVEGAANELYKWVVLAMQEDWLTVDELYDLNFAFVYAAGNWQQPINYDLFDETVAYQFDLLDEEENEP